ncbi:MAG: ATP-binding protein [Streptosporangiaceae bacterium]
MTTRIVLALVAFTAAVLVGAVVPLTLNATGHDRTSFVQATAATARTDAALAQTRLDFLAQQQYSGHLPSPATGRANLVQWNQVFAVLQNTRQSGDGLLILTNTLRTVVQLGMPAGNFSGLAEEAAARAQPEIKAGQVVQAVTETTGSQVIAVVPVFGQGAQIAPVVGTVIVARPTKTLESNIVALWVILGTISALAMIAAAVLAFGLARWVSSPLKGLDAAARRLADGDLAIRTVVSSGPPELRRLGTTFNTMAGRLEALVHGNRAVIADVSHQLRTPLAALRLRLDLLAADAAQSDPATSHELAGALDELARLSRLVDGLLAVARAENVVPVPAAVDIAEVARERVVAWHPVADDRSIVLTATSAGGVGAPDASVLAWIGEGHLEQILDNLIANALEALSPGQRVTVISATTPTGARITVRDHGPGMSAEDRERAFLRFGVSSPNGTGLGLAIVHRLTTSNGGTASLAQTPGGGLTVTLDFPGVPAPNGGAPHNGTWDYRLSPSAPSGRPDNAIAPAGSSM